MTVILAPAGSTPPEQARPGETRQPDGTKQVTDRAHSGQVLMVRSDPDGGSKDAPYSDRLAAVADGLAGRL